MESFFIEFLAFLNALRQNALIVFSVFLFLASRNELQRVIGLHTDMVEISLSCVSIGSDSDISSGDSIVSDIE